MCGIVGFTHKHWVPDPDRIRMATDTLIHRGPDEQGVYRSAVCSMGATRLKIIDLEGGDQPIQSEDGNSAIVFNGEIYNHLELRKELETLGHRFQSHCDTETVFRAFLQWETGAFARMHGMFAVALWTASSRRLVLARDRMGIKPLYITRRGEDLFFGSELKAIFVHPEIERRLSLDGLDCYLSLNYVPAPWTMVEGITKVMPGTWVEWQDGAMRSQTYWRLPDGVDGRWTLDSAKQALDSLLDQSVREHLLSDVPLGVWLSGGVDSSAILHYASHASTSRLKTFSISFRGRSFDETEYIQQAVKAYDTEHAQLDLTPEHDLVGAIEQFAYYSDEPSADAGALPVWFLSKLCKTQTTVALSGEGADELFGGYLTYRANEFARSLRRIPPSALKLALNALRWWPVSDDKISLEYKLKRLLEGSLMPSDQAHVYWNGTFSEPEKRLLLRTDSTGAFARVLSSIPQPPAEARLADYLKWDQQYYLADDILVKSDRMSMAHAVEVRPPYLDHRIVEFAATLPDSLKIRGSRQKFLLKELMRDKLPPAILQRKKMGFDIPAHEWFRGPLLPLLTEILREGMAEYQGVFNSEVIQAYLQRHLERRINVGYHLWGLMILLLWMKKWRIQAPATATANQELQVATTGTYI
ncbi:MAG: asparagine synthase (glutamine-hydrolyzing) [Acidobacteriota bacterium]|nr:asparagine synthase (glutamine-hydrolyzing) [Acidobacteriota bacterium]